MTRISGDRWPMASIVLHWLSVLLLVTLVLVGGTMVDLDASSNQRRVLSVVHLTAGVALMIAMGARLVLRRRRVPEPIPGLEPLHQRGIAIVHTLLYVVVFALGGSGVATALAADWPSYLASAGTAPDTHLFTARVVHETFVVALMALIALHVAGVVIHQVRRGGALRRMLPTRGTKPVDEARP